MPKPSQMTVFAAAVAAAHGPGLAEPAALQAWSVREWPTFWRFFLDWCQLRPGLQGTAEPVCLGTGIEEARFFPRLRLNWSELLLNLAVVDADQPALVACHADGGRESWSRGALRSRVAQLADAFDGQGLSPGDVVVAVLRNDAEAAALALAVAAVGATLCVAAPDMGLEALAERFGPLGPRWLLAHCVPRPQDAGCPLDDKVEALARRLPTLQALVGIDAPPPRGAWQAWPLEALAATGRPARFDWPRQDFNHPLFILFSSGTTGRPKAIVHGAGGTLLEQLKEHRLHSDLRPGERLYFHTSCSWMMWQWQLAALASGVTLVLYDGPVDGAETLWSLVARERVNVFGTSPAYLRLSQSCGLEPGREFELSALRAILSTGAILSDAQFDWVARAVGPQPLQSISGGTDILGCFVLGHPDLPVRRGQAQCRSLGLDVQAWRDGKPLPLGEGVGQLVCANPFPSRPLGLHGDPEGRRFHAAYFAEHPGVWTHGDLIEFGSEGGARLHGRCDGLLNVRGIKLAPAEIARALEGEPALAQLMVLEQPGDPPLVLALWVREARGADRPGPAEEAEGAEEAEEAARIARWRRVIAQRLSPAHVPDRFLQVPALPVTHNGKPSEAAARAAVQGRVPENLQALRNPESLAAITRAAAALRLAGPAVMDSQDPPPVCEGAPVHPVAGGAGACASAGADLLPRMQALWAEVLHLPTVGPDAHFMDLGGTSLHAAMIVSRLRRLAGCRLPLASLLRAPTPRQLAALARRTRQGEVSAAHPLWVGLREGAGRPLVLVHGLSGTVMECWPLVQALGGSRPVAGLQARGLDGGPLPPARVEAIAADYVEVLRRAQPQGPYALCGFSFGGLVALEMARRLCAQGEAVELLCLVDPYLRRGLPAWRQWWLRARAALHRLGRMDAASRVAYLLRQVRRLTAGGAPGQAGEGGERVAGRCALGVGAAGYGDPLAPPSAMGPRQRAVRASLLRSLAAYEPAPYAGSGVLFIRAQEPLPGYFDPMPVWRRALRGPLRLATLPGPHLDLVRGQAEGLAGLLGQALEEAQGLATAPARGAAFRPAGGSPSPARPRSSIPG